MNIRDIMYQASSGASMQGVFGNSSQLLSIGSKGQVVEGLVSKVSDKISISFNGIEVKVPNSAVRGATEGEVRKFQIMDVSKDNIVLKEVGNIHSQSDTKAMVNTKVPESALSHSAYIKESAQVAAGEQEANKNIAILTGEDYESIEKEEGAVEDFGEASLERTIERVKEQKQWEENCQESNKELCQQLKKGLENIQKNGFLDQKTEAQIAQLLRDADIPPTEENISKFIPAFQMSQTAGNMSDDVRAYIIGNGLPPTIENIYHGQYSGSDAFDGAVYDDEMWDVLSGQVNNIIDITGLDKQTATEDAKWLLANELPVTADNLKMLSVLRDIKENITPDVVINQIIQAMSAGSGAEQALLDTSQFVIARDIINSFMSVTDKDIITAVNLAGNSVMAGDTTSTAAEMVLNLELIKQAQKINENNNNQNITVIPGVVTDGMTEQDIQAVTAKRHIAEICLKMTIQSAGIMAEKGINVETAPLEDVVKELRDIENSYYKARFGTSGDITDKELGLMQETLQKTADIANAPASVIGTSVKQLNLITLNGLHAAAASETAQRQQFMEIYEKVSTEANKEYGDSITKAFKSIPDILKGLGIEDTQANERAARILGYNSMEITEESIQAVKEYDSMLNKVIDNMKPSVVLELIRNGSNPLDKTISELDKELSDIAQSKDISSEEKYSRYLWQLERSNAITEQEREGYIGVYRLLNNIEKTDGAAIGAVLQSRREMTLGNLLSAVRTSKGKGINIEAGSNFGGLEELVYHSKTITAQINEGFNNNTNNNNRDSDSSRYYQDLVSEALNNITPDGVNEISDGDMEKILNTSLEKFAEDMKSSTAGRKLEKEYYEQQAEEVREIVQDNNEAEAYLSSLQIPVTVAVLDAAGNMLKEGYNPLKECYNRRNVLDRQEQQEFEDTIDSMADALGSEESIQEECERAGKYMEEILAKSYSAPDISSDELVQLKMLGRGIQLNGLLSGRRSYDIPVVTGDTITNMNVTILSGYGDKGKVQVSVNTHQDMENIPGSNLNISAEFRISGGALKGLVLCGSREDYETVMESSKELEVALSEAGFSVKNISCSIGGSSRNTMLKEKADTSDTPTADLYKAAKIAVKYISGIISKNINVLQNQR